MGRAVDIDSLVQSATPGGGLRVAQMVGRSFRCGMLARRENPAIAWSYAWQEIAGVAGAGHADRLVVALGAFINSVESAAARRIEVLPKGCPGLCRDECLVVSIVAASQLGACPALKACVFALIDSGNVEPCIRSAGLFSTALSDAGQTLPPDVVCNALALMAGSSGRMFADA
ncbi:MAG: hypothetical protein ACXW13_07850 [Burkholderiaceae bacterium]